MTSSSTPDGSNDIATDGPTGSSAGGSRTHTDRVALLEQHLQAVAAHAHLDPQANAPASARARQRQLSYIQLQQRRRTRGRLMLGSVVGLTAATVVATAATHDWAGTVSTTTVTAASSTLPSNPSATTPTAAAAAAGAPGAAACLAGVSQPSWRPSIVAAQNVVCPADGDRGAAGAAGGATSSAGAGEAATLIEYKLSGAPNQESLSSDPNVVSPTGQAETDITFISYPVPDFLDPIDRGNSVEGIDVSTVRLSNGFDARLSQGTNGYGAVRVAWSDGKHSYLLLTTNYKTTSGTSGPSISDMIKMAGSVPTAR